MRKTIGAFEKVSFPDFHIHNVIAKIDTGALSGALHATHVKIVKLKTGKKGLKFLPYGKAPSVIVSKFSQKEVRSSNGAIAKRYIIPTTVVIGGVQYPIQISLADRSSMMKGVLIGRQFLRRHGFLVDAKEGTKYRYEVK